MGESFAPPEDVTGLFVLCAENFTPIEKTHPKSIKHKKSAQFRALF
jgi:hypothetical protein